MALHIAYAHDDYTLFARLHAGTLCCVALLCAAFAPVRVLPAIAIGLGYFYVAFGAPVFSRGTSHALVGTIHLPTRALENATLATLCFAFTVVAVALLVDRVTRRFAWRVTSILDNGNAASSADTQVARLIAACSIGLNTAIMLGVPFGSLKNAIVMFSSPLIPITLLYWDAERNQASGARFLFWGAVGYLAFTGLLTGMVQDALMPGVFTIALIWAHRARFQVGLVAVCAAVLIFLTPVKHVYRRLAWYENSPSLVERVALWGVAIEKTYGGSTDGEEALGRSAEGAYTRAGMLGQVAHIFEAVPSRIPFAGPERWLAIPRLTVPRILWPEKPTLVVYFNRNYTQTFRMQGSRVSGGTTLNLPSVGDGYWRLGWPGVFVEAALLGLLLGLAQATSRGGTRSALLLAGALMQVRTDAHTFGTIIGTMQLVLVSVSVALAAKVLAEFLSSAQSTVVRSDARPPPAR